MKLQLAIEETILEHKKSPELTGPFLPSYLIYDE